MASQRHSRLWSTLVATALITLTLLWAFWPRAMLVDMGKAIRGPMQITLNEEARTRVRDAYVVSAPIAGRLLRVEAEPGDQVIGGETVIARMLPIHPSALDIRTREQGLAAVRAAEAALDMARADHSRALADQELAELELQRLRRLHSEQIATRAELDQAIRTSRASAAGLDTARAAISMREAELANARARLISFNEPAERQNMLAEHTNTIPLVAPVSGRILQVLQKSETSLATGTTILEIGDTANDLEVIVELLSTDAVKVSAGDRVIIDNWGGPHRLAGFVERVEPWGFTKYSALGVEEQRVNAIIRFSSTESERESLGHGYRVEARIVLWETEDALIIPASALFRQDGNWMVFVVDGQRTHLRQVSVGHNNGSQAEITHGLEAGDSLILYPGPDITQGSRVTRRQVLQ
ncbi:MAG TPA: HlyD family efflux transporter periplasmic adaptor subunit [Cellvibrionaceae bacterium]